MSPEPAALEPHVLMTDLLIGESPRWHEDRLWFCHWGAHDIVAVDVDGKSEVVFHDPAISPHSIEWLPDGRLLILPKSAEHKGLLLRRELNGSIVTHADLRGLAAGWNEIVVDGRGNIYVNGSDFDFLAFLKGEAEFVPGIIALVTPDGSVRQVAAGIEFANGMALTADNSTLVVSESFAAKLTAFDVAADGSLSNRRVWADGLSVDGICIDAEGAVWTSTDTMEMVRVREGGEVLPPRIQLDRRSFACMLGGADRRTLFVMAAEWRPENPFGEPRTGQVLTAPAPSSGVGWP